MKFLISSFPVFFTAQTFLKISVDKKYDTKRVIKTYMSPMTSLEIPNSFNAVAVLQVKTLKVENHVRKVIHVQDDNMN